MADRDSEDPRRDVLAALPEDLNTAGFEDAQAIGHGGFGVVFRCRQRSLDRLVAVKVLTTGLDTDNLDRFLREQQAMSRLSGHPNIVNVFEAGATRGGFPYIVMQYQPRGSLEVRIRRDGPLEWAETLSLGVKIAGALETAHRLAVLHRDIKPANILLTEYGDPQLTDFGIAHVAGAFETTAGAITGSPAFTAPEVLTGGSPSPAADVYSLGATLFCALTGHAPFERQAGEQVVAQFLRITADPLPDVRGHGIPDDIYDTVEQAMARDRGERPATAADFGERLRAAERRHKLQVVDMAVATPDSSAESRRGNTDNSDEVVSTSSTGTATEPALAAVSTTPTSTGRNSAPEHDPPMPARQNSRPGNLPLELTSFVGRRHELAQAKKALSACRLVTLTGMGGVGKTRLALRIATESRRAFADGTWLVELGELRDPALVASAVSTALGIRQDSGDPPLTILMNHLAEHQTLLVLDNCEHLVETIAPLAATLLHACAGLRVLATSREPLRVNGEMAIRVPPLPIPNTSWTPSLRGLPQYESVSLFAERAAAAVPEFELTDDNQAAVAHICQQLDGLPLAIELAAARLRAMSTQQILDRLTDRFRLLALGSRSAHTRQQTLRFCIDWSYELCTPDEQHLWSLLSVFAGSFELDAAQAISAEQIEPEDLVDVVASLVDKSILIREEPGAVVRYRLLDTLREYGQEKLEKYVELAVLQGRHQLWYEQLVLRAETDWISPRQLDWILRLEQEQPNIREALQFCLDEPVETEAGTRIAAALFPFWLSRGLLTEGRLWLARMTGQPGDHNTEDWVKATYLACVLAGLQGDLPTGMALLTTGDATRDQSVSTATTAYAEFAAGYMALYNSAPLRAIAHLEEALTSSKEGRLLVLPIGSLLGLGLAYMQLGDAPKALDSHEQILADTAGCREFVYRGRSSVTGGWALWRNGDLKHATAALAEGLRLSSDVDDPVGVARCLQTLAWIEADQHHEQRAAVLLGAADSVWRAVGGPTANFLNKLSDHTECERHAQQTLGDREFAKQFHRGNAMSLKEAAEYAFGRRQDSETPAQSAALANLTRRERQVAELVAGGLTNKAIATKLVVAPRTAEGHVEHILTKLGFTSRAQIAAWFVDQSQPPSP
ncbi:protein kinase domain-containing protein [Nocardia sp. CA-107356]|uniref:protein kinase domain-containing protein n=1 Tax=Nocardia sp. CA-107356 TaxID=3239972 RepID=UPI003D9139B2